MILGHLCTLPLQVHRKIDDSNQTFQFTQSIDNAGHNRGRLEYAKHASFSFR